MTAKQTYLYKLIPPRPTFFADQTNDEAAIMAEHVAYWRANMAAGSAVAFGPVLEPNGVWGLAVVEVDSEDDAQRLPDCDPAVTSGLAHAEIYPMPRAVARPHGPTT